MRGRCERRCKNIVKRGRCERRCKNVGRRGRCETQAQSIILTDGKATVPKEPTKIGLLLRGYLHGRKQEAEPPLGAV